MLAARANQENAIYEQQQAAAAKPLNHGVKGLAPKTPSNKQPKTPFGKARNDENITVNCAKRGANEGCPEHNAFVTPANPRTRAPLGNKTTNAKAFQTPAPRLTQNKGKEGDGPSSTKPTSPRLRRSKIKVHQSTSAEARQGLAEAPEEREIEHMPPREVPLPDTHDDFWPHECDFSVLHGTNRTRGWWSEFAPGRNEDDPDLSDFDENCRKAEERNRKEAETRKVRASKSASGARSGPSAAAAQNAASALGSRPAKNLSGAAASSSAVAKKPTFDRVNPRFTAAKAASNSTIGYSKGRAVSSSRRPLADLHSLPPVGTADNKTTLDHLLSLGGLDIADEDADLGLSTHNNGLDLLVEDDEELEVFQLDPVQDS